MAIFHIVLCIFTRGYRIYQSPWNFRRSPYFHDRFVLQPTFPTPGVPQPDWPGPQQENHPSWGLTYGNGDVQIVCYVKSKKIVTWYNQSNIWGKNVWDFKWEWTWMNHPQLGLHKWHFDFLWEQWWFKQLSMIFFLGNVGPKYRGFRQTFPSIQFRYWNWTVKWSSYPLVNVYITMENHHFIVG